MSERRPGGKWRCAVHGTMLYGKQLWFDPLVAGGLRCRQNYEQACIAAAAMRVANLPQPSVQASEHQRPESRVLATRAVEPATEPQKASSASAAASTAAKDPCPPAKRPPPPPGKTTAEKDTIQPMRAASATAPQADSDSAEPATINLLEVKEEPVDEVCKHTDADSEGKAWPLKRSFETWVWSGNKYPPERVPSLIATLDSVMFQANMRGWADVQRHMIENQDALADINNILDIRSEI